MSRVVPWAAAQSRVDDQIKTSPSLKEGVLEQGHRLPRVQLSAR